MGNQIARTAHRTVHDPDIPPEARNDRWRTPMPIIEALTPDRPFDLDPCGAPAHPTAQRVFLLENGDNGLTNDWIIPWDQRPLAPAGAAVRVWMNPPYGRSMTKWVTRFLDHYEAGLITGTMLIPVAMGTKLWQDLVGPKASAILFWRHRINFHTREGGPGAGMVSMQASALVAFGKPDADALAAAIDLPGLLYDFPRPS